MTLQKIDWRTTTAAMWQRASMPYRACLNRRDAARGMLPIPALFYHRVADTHPTPWTISRADFERQIDWMAKRFEFISLDELQRRMQERSSFRAAVAITFDDGYRENLDFALPLLLRLRIPVTYYVTAGNVLSGKTFPHDRELGLDLPPHSADEIADLAREGIDIGVHTMTHRDLGQALSEAELHEEIIGAREALESLTARSLRHFAFPFGQRENVSPAAVKKVREAGYASWSSAFGGYNVPGRSPDHILRFHGDPSLVRLSNWLTGDPRWRKVRADDLHVQQEPA
ncbi:MAG TPA: polysaccharide deacetylase family protein [Pirellulaceae bacterium]|jgi:peptidoglycan/xylan/chitin deacetylase (PgdA/CDA1 family)|nr:polysaccharide deacetylase family protein [Pirellulaceae bacterium]